MSGPGALRAARLPGARLVDAAGLLAVILPLGAVVALLVGVLWQALAAPAVTSALLPAVLGSGILVGLAALLAVPLGVGAALYLEEYSQPEDPLTRIIELNTTLLAGAPSILYGLAGAEVFARGAGLGGVGAGGVTLALLITPHVLLAARAGLRAVPAELREGACALGAGRLTVLREVVLPVALPAMAGGIVRALARGLGEAAPLLLVLSALPATLVTALPLLLFDRAARAPAEAAAVALVLLAMTLALQGLAGWLERASPVPLPPSLREAAAA